MCGVSLLAAYLRRERSLWSDAAAVLASSGMAIAV
ncbi:MAG: hypothetical protein UHD09_06720 [Bifidobacterium sp.]|nr:hypothetical protein [Bifidobacterium sp.]